MITNHPEFYNIRVLQLSTNKFYSIYYRVPQLSTKHLEFNVITALHYQIKRLYPIPESF